MAKAQGENLPPYSQPDPKKLMFIGRLPEGPSVNHSIILVRTRPKAEVWLRFRILFMRLLTYQQLATIIQVATASNRYQCYGQLMSIGRSCTKTQTQTR